MSYLIRRRDLLALAGGISSLPLSGTFPSRAQQRAVPVVGYLNDGVETPPGIDAFRRGLAEQGYVEGRNVEILYRHAEFVNERLPAMATELVRRHVSAIAATGFSSALAAKSATETIPVVFANGSDPVEFGLVSSLNRPGANVTGITFLSLTLAAKRLELLHEIRPGAASFGLLVNPTVPTGVAQTKETEIAARVLGVRLSILKAGTPTEIDNVFAGLAGARIDALSVASDQLFFTRRDQFAALATKHRVPTIYDAPEIVRAGGLMSYGPNIFDAIRLAGNYVGRILKGEKPSDLPVQQSTRIEMALNLKTAKALGIEVPTATLLRATEVIE